MPLRRSKGLATIAFYVWALVRFGAQGHGRLLEPPGRSTMWRLGYKTPHNYDDNQLYCGGKTRQWQTYGGKCGPCGDSWGDGNEGRFPRPNEAGGKYGTGLIVRTYDQGNTMNAIVELTAAHLGYFEFQLCPTNDKFARANDTCFQNHKIQVKGRGDHRYYEDQGSAIYNVTLELPRDIHCTHCVFLWRYRAGNSWGICLNGTNTLGCGAQEEFRGCADIRINKKEILPEEPYIDDCEALIEQQTRVESNCKQLNDSYSDWLDRCKLENSTDCNAISSFFSGCAEKYAMSEDHLNILAQSCRRLNCYNGIKHLDGLNSQFNDSLNLMARDADFREEKSVGDDQDFFRRKYQNLKNFCGKMSENQILHYVDNNVTVSQSYCFIALKHLCLEDSSDLLSQDLSGYRIPCSHRSIDSETLHLICNLNMDYRPKELCQNFTMPNPFLQKRTSFIPYNNVTVIQNFDAICNILAFDLKNDSIHATCSNMKDQSLVSKSFCADFRGSTKALYENLSELRIQSSNFKKLCSGMQNQTDHLHQLCRNVSNTMLEANDAIHSLFIVPASVDVIPESENIMNVSSDMKSEMHIYRCSYELKDGSEPDDDISTPVSNSVKCKKITKKGNVKDIKLSNYLEGLKFDEEEEDALYHGTFGQKDKKKANINQRKTEDLQPNEPGINDVVDFSENHDSTSEFYVINKTFSKLSVNGDPKETGLNSSLHTILLATVNEEENEINDPLQMASLQMFEGHKKQTLATTKENEKISTIGETNNLSTMSTKKPVINDASSLPNEDTPQMASSPSSEAHKNKILSTTEGSKNIYPISEVDKNSYTMSTEQPIKYDSLSSSNGDEENEIDDIPQIAGLPMFEIYKKKSHAAKVENKKTFPIGETGENSYAKSTEQPVTNYSSSSSNDENEIDDALQMVGPPSLEDHKKKILTIVEENKKIFPMGENSYTSTEQSVTNDSSSLSNLKLNESLNTDKTTMENFKMVVDEPIQIRLKNCLPNEFWKGVPDMDLWCLNNCDISSPSTTCRYHCVCSN